MAELMQAITRTLDIDSALMQVYGLDQHGIDSAWRQELGLEPLPKPEDVGWSAGPCCENIPDATIAPILVPSFNSQGSSSSPTMEPAAEPSRTTGVGSPGTAPTGANSGSGRQYPPSHCSRLPARTRGGGGGARQSVNRILQPLPLKTGSDPPQEPVPLVGAALRRRKSGFVGEIALLGVAGQLPWGW